MLRALAIDIDGTLTDRWRRLNFRAGELVREIESRGVKVILATGNVLCVADTVRVMLGTSGAVIAENGGVISYAQDDVEILGDSRKVKKAVEYLRKKLRIREVPGNEYRITEIAIWRDYQAEELQKLLSEFDVEVVDTRFALHIKSRNVSKGRALERVAERLNLSLSEIAAIGDSENDRDMLERAGFSISIGRELADVADYVTEKDYGEGGVEALRLVLRRIL